MKKALVYLLFFILLIASFLTVVFWDYDFSASKLAVINREVPEFSFKDQNGNTVTNALTDGKVYVAEYFFTTCRGICPIMNANMRRVYDAYKEDKEVMILSHTCMPETDSQTLMKAYEKWMLLGKLMRSENGSYSVSKPDSSAGDVANNKQWLFLTGGKEELYKMARKGYMIDNGKPDSLQNIQNQFIHSQFFSLVDRNRRVRGIYDGLKDEEVRKLIEDIKLLLKEKVGTARFMNGFSNAPG